MSPLKLLIGVLLAIPVLVSAQIAPARTWTELREAVQDRVNRNAYPLTGYNKDEVRDVLSRISSLDRDEWARSWIIQGDIHAAQARADQQKDPAKARAAYLNAFRYYSFGAWPTQNAEGKRQALRLANEAFRAYARTSAAHPVEVIRIPFEGKEIIGYLQLPATPRPAPVVITTGGLDVYKEGVVEILGESYLAAGLGYLALDMPGTNESPVMADVGSERVFSRAIDYLLTRKDIDPKRIAMLGASWGGHWSARIGILEKDRIRAAVNWGGPVDGYFQRDWQLKALGTREYLFDLFEARAAVYGAKDLESFLQYGPRMSLKTANLLDRPSAPMLLLNGEKDTQVPIEDLYVMLRSGSVKEAWVNPQGAHIGRGPGWPDLKIFREVVAPWLVRALKPQ